MRKLTAFQRELLSKLQEGVKVEVVMTPLVYVSGKQIPFAPFLHLQQQGLVDVLPGDCGVQPVKLTEEGQQEAAEGKRIADTVKRLKSFKQMELVT